MSYLTQAAIASNQMMLQRVSQCAAQQGKTDADYWTSNNRRTWAASPGWDTAWESAMASHPDDPEYDAGKDEAVVTDQMILAQVQAMIAAEPEPAVGPGPPPTS